MVLGGSFLSLREQIKDIIIIIIIIAHAHLFVPLDRYVLMSEGYASWLCIVVCNENTHFSQD
jgi:hypothetical protein